MSDLPFLQLDSHIYSFSGSTHSITTAYNLEVTSFKLKFHSFVKCPLSFLAGF